MKPGAAKPDEKAAAHADVIEEALRNSGKTTLAEVAAINRTAAENADRIVKRELLPVLPEEVRERLKLSVNQATIRHMKAGLELVMRMSGHTACPEWGEWERRFEERFEELLK